MLSTSDIEKNIDILDKVYNESSSILESNLYSKLAVLELGGWIELAMDDIVKECSTRILGQKSQEKIDGIVSKTYGFDYNIHFIEMLHRIIGFKGIEDLENEVDQIKFQKFKSNLGMLTTPRNTFAHNPTEGVALTVDSPSKTKSKIEPISEGLKEIDDVLKKLGY